MTLQMLVELVIPLMDICLKLLQMEDVAVQWDSLEMLLYIIVIIALCSSQIVEFVILQHATHASTILLLTMDLASIPVKHLHKFLDVLGVKVMEPVTIVQALEI